MYFPSPLYDSRDIPAVRKLLNDPDSNVRNAAAGALEALGVSPLPASQPVKP